MARWAHIFRSINELFGKNQGGLTIDIGSDLKKQRDKGKMDRGSLPYDAGSLPLAPGRLKILEPEFKVTN
jgi:hypothetical protein